MTQEALKMALYYLEQSDNYLGSLDHSKPIAAIKEALAQIEQKQDGDCKYCTDGCPACDAKKLPPQRTWVGLTDEEMAECFEAKVISDRLKADAKRIEAKLKERNN